LTPAFAVDSSPEVAAEAISICAEFLSSDIVKDVDHMGRLLKILVAGLVSVEGDGS
jgi:HEAT repeat-containing protein 5